MLPRSGRKCGYVNAEYACVDGFTELASNSRDKSKVFSFNFSSRYSQSLFGTTCRDWRLSFTYASVIVLLESIVLYRGRYLFIGESTAISGIIWGKGYFLRKNGRLRGLLAMTFTQSTQLTCPLPPQVSPRRPATRTKSNRRIQSRRIARGKRLFLWRLCRNRRAFSLRFKNHCVMYIAFRVCRVCRNRVFCSGRGMKSVYFSTAERRIYSYSWLDSILLY